MLEWAKYNLTLLTRHEPFATATTGHLLHDELGLQVACFRSGPFGGDQQIGARIAEGEIDLLVFFWDPLEPHPHEWISGICRSGIYITRRPKPQPGSPCRSPALSP
jgi:methylglyoxal synthase